MGLHKTQIFFRSFIFYFQEVCIMRLVFALNQIQRYGKKP